MIPDGKASARRRPHRTNAERADPAADLRAAGPTQARAWDRAAASCRESSSAARGTRIVPDHCHLANEASLAWHRRCGFEEIPDFGIAGHRRNYYRHELERRPSGCNKSTSEKSSNFRSRSANGRPSIRGWKRSANRTSRRRIRYCSFSTAEIETYAAYLRRSLSRKTLLSAVTFQASGQKHRSTHHQSLGTPHASSSGMS